MRPNQLQLEALARFRASPEWRYVKELLGSELERQGAILDSAVEPHLLHRSQGAKGVIAEFLNLAEQAGPILSAKKGG